MLCGLLLAATIAMALGSDKEPTEPLPQDFAPYASQLDWSPIDQLLKEQIAFAAFIPSIHRLISTLSH